MKLHILPCTIAATIVLASFSAPSALVAQATPAPEPAQTTATPAAAPAQATDTQTSPAPATKPKKVPRSERAKQTKDVKQQVKKDDKFNTLAGKDQQLPDKQLYDKALVQEKAGHYDVARLDLQTLLNTYPDSPYQMRSKLAIADCWYREGGSAALTQAAQEYLDFETFFPNAPEAAEAQMRIGDIYFKQMDVPDRDYTKALHAEEAYRQMLKQYPDAPKDIITQTKQKLREVQEVLAIREASLAAYYSTHLNWPATIARYQTVVDTYPQFSHMDDTLIGMGDAYEAEATIVRANVVCQPGIKPGTPCFMEAVKASLLQEFDGKAAAAYRSVVLEHSAAPHVEDAKERLIAMNLPVPTPTAAQVAASEELEGSRAQYTLAKRLQVLFMHSPDTVVTARMGEPPLDDPSATTAPAVVRYITDSYKYAGNPAANAKPGDPDPNVAHAAAPPAPATPVSPAPVTPTASGAALSLSDVPAAGAASDPTINTVEAAPASTGSGTGVGVEILSTGNGARTAPASTVTPPSSLPAATGAPDPNHGLPTVGNRGEAGLAPIEKPEAAPDVANDAAGKPQPPAPAKAGTKKTKAPAVDKNDESSSKKKPKKGLDKLNPF
jgi:outer membrane protein assembly factor BamD